MKDDISVESGVAILKLKASVYPIDVVYSAAYTMLDKAYILFDGDQDEVIVSIRSKEADSSDELVKSLGVEFADQLINYGVYKNQAEKNAGIRQAIIQRVLLTNGFNSEAGVSSNGGVRGISGDQVGTTAFDENIDDPEGILIPWEEKYGGKSDEDTDKETKGDKRDE